MLMRAVVVLAVLAIADSASSQSIPQVQFRWQAIANAAPGFANSPGNGFATGSVLNGTNTLSPQSSGTFRQTFALQVNVTSNVGVANAGLAVFAGDIHQSEPGLLAPGVGGTGRKGATSAFGSSGVWGPGGISQIDGAQNPRVPGSISWPESEPAPLPPSGKPANFGVNQFVTVYQVTFETSDLSARKIELDFALGLLTSSSIVQQWKIGPDSATGLPPNPPGFPGDSDVLINWFPIPINFGDLPPVASPVGFSFTFIPTPPSAILLCFGGLVAFRRRR